MSTATKINVDSIEPSHRSGLLFSMYEGLKSGEEFTIISEGSLDSLKQELESAKVQNLKLDASTQPTGINEIKVKKIMNKTSGCCGGCGG